MVPTMVKAPRPSAAIAATFAHCSARASGAGCAAYGPRWRRPAGRSPPAPSRPSSADQGRRTACGFGQVALNSTPGRRRTPRSTTSASANCGTCCGWEKLVISIRRKPQSAMRSIIAIFASAGTDRGLMLQPVAGEAFAEHHLGSAAARRLRSISSISAAVGRSLMRGRSFRMAMAAAGSLRGMGAAGGQRRQLGRGRSPARRRPARRHGPCASPAGAWRPTSMATTGLGQPRMASASAYSLSPPISPQ